MLAELPGDRLMRLIPALDLKDGHCVRLLRGDFDAETRYDADPSALLAKYRGLRRRLAAHRRFGRRSKRQQWQSRDHFRTRQRERVMLAGGRRMRDTLAVSQMLNAGVGRAVIGSAAVTRVDLVRTWLEDFGAERIVLALDVRLDPLGTPRVAIHGWREQSELSSGMRSRIMMTTI